MVLYGSLRGGIASRLGGGSKCPSRGSRRRAAAPPRVGRINFLFTPAPGGMLGGHAEEIHPLVFCPGSNALVRVRGGRRAEEDIVLHKIKRLRALGYFVEGRSTRLRREGPAQAGREEWLGVPVLEGRLAVQQRVPRAI